MIRDERYERLQRELRPLGRALVAFSGGVDSTFLLHAAREVLEGGVLAVTLATPYAFRAEVEEGRAAARGMGVRHEVLDVPFLEAIRENPPDRCYTCKRHLFSLLRGLAAKEGIEHVLDGTNADDLSDYRPGLRALRELGIESPLLAADLSKADVRELSKACGLSTWSKPAAACLLSRIPHGARIEEIELRRIEAAEIFLRGLGFAAVRLRSHGDVARIEVPAEHIPELVAAASVYGVDVKLKSLGYRHVAVDLAGYRMGSLNEPDNERIAGPDGGEAMGKEE